MLLTPSLPVANCHTFSDPLLSSVTYFMDGPLFHLLIPSATGALDAWNSLTSAHADAIGADDLGLRQMFRFGAYQLVFKTPLSIIIISYHTPSTLNAT